MGLRKNLTCTFFKLVPTAFVSTISKIRSAFGVDNRHSMLFTSLQISNLNVSNLCYHPKWDSVSQALPQLLLYILWKYILNGRQGTQTAVNLWKSRCLWILIYLFKVFVTMVPLAKFLLIPIIFPFLPLLCAVLC